MTTHDCRYCHMSPGSDTAHEVGCLCHGPSNNGGHAVPACITKICPVHGSETWPTDLLEHIASAHARTVADRTGTTLNADAARAYAAAFLATLATAPGTALQAKRTPGTLVRVCLPWMETTRLMPTCACGCGASTTYCGGRPC